MNPCQDAERRTLESHAICEAAPGPEHEHTIEVLRLIADLYESWQAEEPDAGHDHEAVEWRGRGPEAVETSGVHVREEAPPWRTEGAGTVFPVSPRTGAGQTSRLLLATG